MLSRVHRRTASRIAAALVAVALSGAGEAIAEASRTPGEHVCHCPRGDHHCTCPVCSRAFPAARGREADPGARHLSKGGATDGEREPCGVTSACHLPEVAAAIDGREPFALADSAGVVSEGAEERALPVLAAPREQERRPAVPPPRSATCS